VCGSTGEVRGGVFVELWFKVDPTDGLARGDRVELLQSTLAEADDLVFLDCADKALRTISFQLNRAEFADGWPERYLWRDTISVPVRNDGVYPWLLGKQAPSRR
jgi:hypothetical protein